jgi:response regulator RpfG family c-di-GMP phosphodiesterase/tRNA A-37 threonylcarbamoyl transferase component Bud32
VNTPERIGKYEVQGVLGRGAVGVVYRGFDPAIRRAVALKVVSKALIEPDVRDHTVKRFRQEAQAVGRLTHPRITAIYDFIETAELACIVMELVDGKSLAAHLKEVKRCELADTWEIARQVLDGLGYTHGQGVIHRDLKPANILIDDERRIKITDFGVARLDSSSLTQVGDVVGTPHYMAPEQFTGLPVTAASDLYQVGVILYELLTGERPFNGTNAEILRRVTLERPLDPSTHNHRISWELDWVVQKALSKDPTDRFASAREFTEALRKGIEDSLGKPLPSPAPEAPKPAAKAPASLVANAKRIANAKPAAKAAAPAEGPKPRVLFVDDEERILNALQALFRDDYHVFTAESGALALELVSKFRIPVVVSDQRMPGMTGVELLRRVRELNPTAVRLLLTGYSDLAAIVGSINEGEVFRFLKKPWDAEEIRTAIAEAVAAAKALEGPPTLLDRLPPQTGAAVLVVDPEPALARGLAKLLTGVAPVERAASAVEAVKSLAAREVGVIVADLAAGRDGLAALFKLLKAERPEVLSILVTDTPDSELAIEMINHAQVYRFLPKPVEGKVLRGHIESALRKYAKFKQVPVLVEQHRVRADARTRKSAWGTRLLAGIRALPVRLLSRA